MLLLDRQDLLHQAASGGVLVAEPAGDLLVGLGRDAPTRSSLIIDTRSSPSTYSA